jgi:hypothetical protein
MENIKQNEDNIHKSYFSFDKQEQFMIKDINKSIFISLILI